MTEDTKAELTAVICFILGVAVGIFIGWLFHSAQIELFKREAVKRGHGEFFHDKDKAPEEWRWKDK